MPESPDRPRRAGRELLDILIAVSAVVISLASLWIALRSDRTQEDLLRSSVWPYVIYDTSNATPSGERHLTYQLRNEGVGPAIVRTFALAYDGRYLRGVDDLFAACCSGTRRGGVFSSTIQGQVIMAHDEIEFIVALPGMADPKRYAMLGRARSHVTVQLCYCSVLGDCWLLDTSKSDRASPVSVCPPAQQPQYTT
jgi:hypothetical protein